MEWSGTRIREKLVLSTLGCGSRANVPLGSAHKTKAIRCCCCAPGIHHSAPAETTATPTRAGHSCSAVSPWPGWDVLMSYLRNPFFPWRLENINLYFLLIISRFCFVIKDFNDLEAFGVWCKEEAQFHLYPYGQVCFYYGVPLLPLPSHSCHISKFHVYTGLFQALCYIPLVSYLLHVHIVFITMASSWVHLPVHPAFLISFLRNVWNLFGPYSSTLIWELPS